MARVVRPNDRKLKGKQVRLITEENENLGVVSFDEAMERAQDAGQDLVEVAEKADPPVCRIMEYGKYLYEEKKKQREKKQGPTRVKEIDFRPNIQEHDYETKLKHLLSFLEKGHKVKVSVFFRGREMRHMESGNEILDRVKEDVADYGKVDSPPKKMGRALTMMLSPESKK